MKMKAEPPQLLPPLLLVHLQPRQRRRRPALHDPLGPRRLRRRRRRLPRAAHHAPRHARRGPDGCRLRPDHPRRHRRV